MALVHQVSGTPYIVGGDSPAGTDCSGLASWTSNVAAGRPAFGSRFTTGSEESALLSRGFRYGTAPGALVVGWNSYHTAVTLPDGTPVASGESGGGVRIGGGGAYQPQFTHHMFLPVDVETIDGDAPSIDTAVDGDAAAGAPDPEPIRLIAAPLPAPGDDLPPPGAELPLPAEDLPPPGAELPPPAEELPPPGAELPPPAEEAPPGELPPPPPADDASDAEPLPPPGEPAPV